MTCGKCTRCGAEDSMFWYPYAFGVAPIPNPADPRGLLDRTQYFMLCDKCQQEFTDFMHKIGPWFDAGKLKKLLDDSDPLPFVVSKEGKE